MAYPSDPAAPLRVRARLLDQLRARLELFEELSDSVRRRLISGDVEGIESATARLETVAQEFKLLAEEYRRIPSSESTDPNTADARARVAFEATAARLARSAALTGGLLARLIAMSRGVMASWTGGAEGSYLPSGQAPDFLPKGIRLKEWV